MVRLLSLFFSATLALATSGAGAAEILIGFANPLTGPYAATGSRNRAAAELAVEDLNAAGGVLGREVRLLAEDDACGVEQAVAAAQRLVEAKVPFVVGHMCSHSSLLAAGIYEVANVVMISPSSTHPRLTEEGRRNVFRVIGRDDRQGRLAGDFLAEHWADRAIAILHDGSTYGAGLAAETRRRLRAHGLHEVLYEAYAPGEQDYAALAARLRDAGVEVLYIGGYGPDAARILLAVQKQGGHPQLIGGDALAMDEFWAVAGPAGEGTIFSGPPDAEAPTGAASVLERLRSRGLGQNPGGIRAYAAVQLWAAAAERAGSIEPAAVSETLRRGRFETAIGPVAFDEKGDLEGADWRWKVWSEGAHSEAEFAARPAFSASDVATGRSLLFQR
ncbi:MAG TPA: branched-chain amino acid ABC transporter substrate-binding protein [Geminicoccaceae bacterium]|nr:branched-chain amino acid ABC transporter substrate-binding protein [Geminicoccaceae bacterium]